MTATTSIVGGEWGTQGFWAAGFPEPAPQGRLAASFTLLA